MGADFVFSGMLFDMTVGMLVGMAASPILMRGIKALNKKRKLDRLLRQIAEDRRKFEKLALDSRSE